MTDLPRPARILFLHQVRFLERFKSIMESTEVLDSEGRPQVCLSDLEELLYGVNAHLYNLRHCDAESVEGLI